MHRKKHSIKRGENYPWFQVSTEVLGTCSPQIRGDHFVHDLFPLEGTQTIIIIIILPV